MITVTDTEAAVRLPDLLDQVAAGEEVLITRGGRPFATIAAPTVKTSHDMTAVIDAIVEARKGVTLGMDWKTLRDEGRR